MTNCIIMIDPAPMPGYYLYQVIKRVFGKIKNWGRRSK